VIRSRLYGILGEDGRTLVRGLTRDAARAMRRWVDLRREEQGADDAEISHELRQRGVATQRRDGLKLRPGGEHQLSTYPPPAADTPHPTEGSTANGSPERSGDPDDPAALVEAIRAGVYDQGLTALADAERAGAPRPEILEAIATRQRALAAIDVLDGTLDDLDRLIAAGGVDGVAEEVLAAERAGKNRKGGVARLERALTG